MTETHEHPTRTLVEFVAGLSFDGLPEAVVACAQALLLDWVASALAGKQARPVTILEQFVSTMGPADGPSEILVSRRHTSPWCAALVNAASSHVVEQDDVHNGSVMHPGTVVFPALLASAQGEAATGEELITAVVAGYEAGIRIGEFLGQSHYRVFHTTGTAGTLAAAAAVAKLLRLDEDAMLHALGNAGTQAAGLWEFLREGAHSKQLHTAKAAADGLLSAYLARDGFAGAHRVLTGAQGMAAGMSRDADPQRLTDRLGERWALSETSIKFHACCRHTHPAADALAQLMRTQQLQSRDIAHVRAYVHQAAIDVLSPASDPQTVHQAKFCMGFVLALIANRGRAGVGDFNDDTLNDVALREWSRRVEMIYDPEIDAAYPDRWLGKVQVDTVDGRTLGERIGCPKGDPDNTLTRAELEDKAHRLAAYRQAATKAEMRAVIDWVWRINEAECINSVFAQQPRMTAARSGL